MLELKTEPPWEILILVGRETEVIIIIKDLDARWPQVYRADFMGQEAGWQDSGGNKVTGEQKRELDQIWKQSWHQDELPEYVVLID